MGESNQVDYLDKITTLCYLINKNQKINVSFQIGYFYDGVFSCGLAIDNNFTHYDYVEDVLKALEDLYLEGDESKLKKELLRNIDNLQYQLSKYQETLAKLEEKHDAI